MNFDKESCVKEESNKHVRKSQQNDVMLVVKVLAEKKAFEEHPGRTHAGIGAIPKDPISNINFSDLSTWLNDKNKEWHLKYD